MKNQENRRVAAMGDFTPIRAFSVEINLIRLRRHLARLRLRDGLTSRARRAAVYARSLKREPRT